MNNFFGTNQLLAADKTEGIHHQEATYALMLSLDSCDTGLEEGEERAISMSFPGQEGSFQTHTVRITG